MTASAVQAQQYWNTNGTLATINTANWSASPGGPFTSAFTTNGNIVFGANSLVTGATVDVGNITVANGFTVTFTAGGTLGTGGNIRTLDVGTGSTLDLAAQALSVAAGSGYIKNGNGTLVSANGNAYVGGFTLNAGTVAVGGVNALGGGAGNTLTINGGTIRSNSTTARDLTGKYAGGITVGGDFTLGDATNNGALTFTNAMALGAANRTITTNSNAVFGGAISGSTGVGLTKAGTGTLTLSGANTFTGAINVNAGSLVVGGTAYPALGGNTPGTNGPSSITVASGATLNFAQSGTGATTANYFQPLTINGGTLITSGGAAANTLALNLNGGLTLGGNVSTTINGNSTLIIPGTTTVSLGANTLTIQTDGSNVGNNIGAAISGTGGSLIKNGGNSLTLSGNNTFTGATTLNTGTLILDYATQDNNKLSDTASLTLGGNLILAGATGSHLEVVASTTLTTGLTSSVTRSGANTAVLQLGTITNNAGSGISFGAAGLATTNNTNNSLGILGFWATINGDGWAVNSTNAPNGLITGAAYTDVTRLSSGTKTIAGGAGHTRIIEGVGTVADITLAAPGVTSTDTLVNTATTAGTVDIGAGNTLRTSAILQGAGAGALTIGIAATPGTLTASTAGGDLAGVANAAITINSVISDNTSASTLTKFGTGTLTLAGNNDYTGATVVNSGTLAIAHNNALGTTAGATTINGGNGTTGVNLDLSSATAGLTIAENLNFSGNLGGRAALVNSSAFNHTLTGSINVSSDTNLVQWNSGGTGSITISGDITGTLANNAVLFVRGTSTSATNRVIGNVNLTGGNFAKTDAGTWLVGAPGKTYSWVNTVLAVGTLKMGAAGVLPSASELIMGNSSGATSPILDLNGFSQTIAGITYSGGSASTGTKTITNTDAINAAVLTVNNAINYSPTGGSAANSVILAGNLSLVKQGAGTLTLSGTNTYTGATTVSAGTLVLAANATGNTALITIGNGATLQSAANFTLGTGQSVTGTGATGFLTISPAGANGFLTTGNSIFNTAGTLTISRLDVRGTGNQLNTGNFVSGGAAVNQRGLLVGNTVASDLTINAGATLTTQGSGTGAQDILGNGTAGNGALIINGGVYNATAGLASLLLGNGASLGGGTLTINTGSANIGTIGYQVGSAQSGIVNLNGGTLTLGSVTSTTVGTREFNFDGGQLVASAGLTLPTSVTANVKNGGAKIDTGANSVSIASALLRFGGTSTGGLTKTGTGILTISGASTYTGDTLVSAGTLLVNGSLATSGSTAVNVSNNATLGGSGSIAAAISINSGGTLSPGTSPGKLTATAPVTMATGSTYTVELGDVGADTLLVAGTDYDQLALTGTGTTLTINPTVALSIVEQPNLAAGQAFVIVDNTATGTISGLFSIGGVPLNEGDTVAGNLGTVFTISYVGNDVTLTAVPEPASVGLLAMAGCGLLARRRRVARAK
ncbi:beta strand repeat-containing protein [Humisphaera borealis]|uniref:Autotransporter-associated beta strand repeat-containing protein n=1 Tax=Humisphaera borealis TaxID=2807512 RepID=A0A7M2WQN2_9BACT|nr:autotransporter-associated beta strand repeat-containing protein [Humisphaera borealis]QOV87808.1 autotransporter-associated beta strand repeat-containing protein [Humisphaera borealis]